MNKHFNKKAVSYIMNEARQKLEQEFGTSISLDYSIRFINISPARVIQTVCKNAELTWSEIVSRSKKKRELVPRQICAWLMYNYCSMTMQSICTELNRDNHTTIRHMIVTVNDMIDTSDELYMPLLKECESDILELNQEAA